MKHSYRIYEFLDDTGETLTAIYCVDLGELAVETRGDIVCTEHDALEDVISDTPWAGADDLSFAEDWREMTAEDYNALNSAGLRDWINAKGVESMKSWAIIETRNGVRGTADESPFDWFRGEDARLAAMVEAENATREMRFDENHIDGDGYATLGFDENGDADDSPVCDWYISREQIYDRVERQMWGAEE